MNKIDKKIKPKLSIVILTYNRYYLLNRLLESIINLKFKPKEIIVVDNCSEDETREEITKYFPEIQYIRTSRNIGTAARNIGIKKSSGEYIVTMDDDLFGLTDEKIKNLVEIFERDSRIGAINFKVLDTQKEICNWVHHCQVEDFHDKSFLTYEITEGAVAFRKEIFDKAGYYPEYFFISHEGPDLALRILENNYLVIYTPEISLVHHIAGEGRKSWRNYYYDTRNQFWLAVRNYSLIYMMNYLFRGQTTMFIYSLRDGFIFFWFKGFYDGIKHLNKVFKERRPLSKKTMNIVKEIDRVRPGILYYFQKRILRKGIKI